MSGKLAGLRVLITGAASGIGYACTERFLRDGAHVMMLDEKAEKLKAACDDLASGAVARVASRICDLGDLAALSSAVDACVERWGGIDVLVNNAGITRLADILTLTAEDYESVLRVNLRAPVFATQAAARHMVRQGTGGVMINMSSVNGVLTIPTILAYNLSKGALDQLTRNTGVALAPHCIRVCGIGPGTILTELTKSTVARDRDALNAILTRTPLGRAGEPEEIAAIAAFLASQDASYITGETIYADGGRLGLNYTVPLLPSGRDRQS